MKGVHIDVLMLDTKTGKGGKSEYCDAIIITDDIAKWEKCIKEQYSAPGYECIEKGEKKKKKPLPTDLEM